MPYITYSMAPGYYLLSFEDVLAGAVNLQKMKIPNVTATRTFYSASENNRLIKNTNVDELIDSLRTFNQAVEQIYGISGELSNFYRSFNIRKRNGKVREINAPLEALKNSQNALRVILEQQFGVLYHTAAFAYVPNRCTKNALEKHQKNESNWFAKLDFKDFFPSISPAFMIEILSSIYPFSEVVKSTDGRGSLEKALSICFLNGGLPQGSPISPMLSNLMMIPIDHLLSNTLRDFGDQRFIYTRYADDIMVSSKFHFNVHEIESLVENVVKRFNAPLVLNKRKTRYGSRSGRNWNLGLMLNKDNDITIGHAKKKIFHATVETYTRNRSNSIQWGLGEVRKLQGLISYYKSIEPDMVQRVLEKYKDKYGIDTLAQIKSDLNGADLQAQISSEIAS